jgi:hypothetical protein
MSAAGLLWPGGKFLGFRLAGNYLIQLLSWQSQNLPGTISRGLWQQAGRGKQINCETLASHLNDDSVSTLARGRQSVLLLVNGDKLGSFGHTHSIGGVADGCSPGRLMVRPLEPPRISSRTFSRFR